MVDFDTSKNYAKARPSDSMLRKKGKPVFYGIVVESIPQI
jgi:hypothetical protein